jgi:ABC-type phosphate transport system substrate-binding protein
MAVVVNKENSINNVSSAHLAKILRQEVRKWPDGAEIVLVLRRNSAGETETLQRLNKMSPSEWNAFLASHKDSIVLVDSDAGVLKMVESDAHAVGLIDVRSIDGTVTVVHVDGKLPMEMGYLPH